jgi:VCBS repeat-containing protein
MPSDAARHAASSLTATAADKTDTFNLTVSDGFGGTVTIPITVAISPLNTAPVAGTATIGAADPVTGRVTGRVNAGDGNGDTLVYSGTSTTPKGAVTINSDGTFTYTPTAAARHNASSDTATPADKTDTFTATATDGHGGTTSLPVTVTISPANSLPSTGNAVVLSLNSATGVVVVKFAGTDADGDNLTFSGSTTTSKGSVVVSADGTLTYSPTDAARHAATASTATAADRNDSFTITVNDGHGGRVDVPLNIAVTASNAAPVATPTVGTPDSSGVVRGTLAATDSDGDAVVYNTGTTATARGSVTLNSDGTFTYTPTNTARHNAASDTASVADKTDSFTATVGDGHGGTTRVTVSVPITSANTPLITGTPTVGSPDGTTGVVTGRLPATDADGDTLDYSGPITTAKGQIVVNSDGTFTYTPTSTARHALSAPDASAEQHMDSFTINVTDGHGSTASVPITVMLTASNAAPVAGTAVMSIPDRSTGLITGTFTDTDADGDELTYTGTGPTSKGVVVVYHDGTFTYTPSTFARQAAFAENATAAQKLDSFTVKVSDGHGGSAEYTVEVPLGFVNAPPTAGTTTVSSPDGVTGGVSGTVTATDLDNDQVTFSGSATTAHGSVIVHPNGTFTYTPTTIARHAASATAASAGDLVDTFTVTATDSRGGTTPIPVTVSIASLNTAPVVGTPTVGRPDSSGSVIGTVLASDPDGDVLSYSVPAKTAKGTVTVDANGTFTYTASKAARDAAASPSAGATDKTDAFTVTITDGHGTTTVVPVAVTVAPSAATVVFNFVYGSGSEYWNASARNAMQAAADILARYLVSANPTTLTYNLIGINAPGSGTLGSAHAYFSSYSTGYFGTVAQTKILTGVDTNGAAADGEITWNFAYPYNYGPAASTTDDSYDFTAVALHELLHTLGFISGIETPNADRNWTTYDNFLADSTGTKVINPDHRFNQAYVPNLTGGNGGIYWNGSNAVAAYGGLVPLYTPSTWSQDASLTHLDPANVGTESQVLNPFEFYGPGVRVLSPVEVGMLKDLGYPISSGSSFAAFALIGFGFLRRAKRNGNEGKDKKRTGNGANAKESAA